MNYCNPNPCQNGGTCVPSTDGTSFSCKCKIGYSGFNCQTCMTMSIVVTTFVPTTSTITTTSTLTTTLTTTRTSTSTTTSTTSTTSTTATTSTSTITTTTTTTVTQTSNCANSQCKNGASCVPTQSAYVCSCLGGYTGFFCETCN